MTKYSATLAGMIDAHVERRDFDDLSSAISWCEGEGLDKFNDKSVRGLIVSDTGNIVWDKSGLRRQQVTENHLRMTVRRILARFGIRSALSLWGFTASASAYFPILL
jgi:hypothetical protein